jgi:hypothetical protein
MKRHTATKAHTSLDHHVVTKVLGIEVVVDNLGQYRQSTTKAQGMEEPKSPGLPPEHMTATTTRKRWAHHALLAEFALHQYPKVLNYPMISKNMTDPKSHHHGSQIIYKQSEYLEGQKKTAMQSLQLHLTGAARSWLSKLERETIESWEELTKQFISNFKSTYKWPASIEEVKACVQQCNETLRSYIQRWSIIKNSVVEVSDERGDLVEEMGRIKPRTISELMDIANRFADGEDACNNKRTRSPEDDRGTDTVAKGEDPATMITTALIVK